MSEQATPQQYLRSAQAPFFRLPLVTQGGAARFGRAKAVLFGAPWDGGASARPGARLGPAAARAASGELETFHPVHRLDVFGITDAVDGGNVLVDSFSWERTESAVRVAVAEAAAGGAATFLVGGDHSLALPALRALAAVHGPLSVVHVDAHFDTVDPETEHGLAFHHGTPLGHAMREGLIAKDQLFQIGQRAPWGSLFDLRPSRLHGARQISVDEVAEQGARTVGQSLRTAIGERPTYVTFDVDALDPAFAPGTGTPVAGGLSSREAIALLRGLAGVHLVGMDVVELCPAYDHAEVTALAAAHLLYEGVALKAVRLAEDQVAAAAPPPTPRARAASRRRR